MRLSKHAQKRMQQRAIKGQELDLILSLGTCIRVPGGLNAICLPVSCGMSW